ncbi:hypothetical protein BN946_scf185015.g28 [Trametes cinnabarina]|uniref:Ubiquitin-like protease family profile domain-containing protein n=1 Tax=Pycnoporus cinnabarinus TaxID=5643 RepID=A0A060SH26_PYCCI|nr:hypothetical protein BN946_scf185015.g28 [Trametes cinnabarina]
MARYAVGRDGSESPSLLQILKAQLLDGPRKRLYFPVNVDNNHWVAFCVDFESRSISYSDSQVPASDKAKPTRTISRIIDALWAWAVDEFSEAIRNQGNALVHGVQRDSSSCAAEAHIRLTQKKIHVRSASPDVPELPSKKERIPSGPSQSPTEAGLCAAVPQADMSIEPLVIAVTANRHQPQVSLEVRKIVTDDATRARLSQSAQDTSSMKDTLTKGRFTVNQRRLNKFLHKIAALDHAAEARQDKKQWWQVWHSYCGTWRTMKEPYNTTRFGDHMKTCNAKQAAHIASSQHEATTEQAKKGSEVARTSTLDKWAKKLGWVKQEGAWKDMAAVTVNCKANSDDESVKIAEASSEDIDDGDTEKSDNLKSSLKLGERPTQLLSARSIPFSFPGSSSGSSQRLPCTGLTNKVDERISCYLRRAYVSGGGSRSVSAIAEELHQTPYTKLSQKDKKAVDAIQLQMHTWRNDHLTTSVWSVACKQFVDVDSPIPTEPIVCKKCRSVLAHSGFKTALRKAVQRASQTVQLKYLNKKYRSETLAHLFARRQGLEAIVMSEDPDASVYARLATGLLKGQLSGYPIVGDLMKALAQLMDREERGVRQQNFQQTASYAPKFPLKVCQETFDNIQEYLRKLNYPGPVALSCDDTKLHATFRTYWDASKECHMLVGGVDEPRVVANAKELEALLADPEIKKATKIQLWCVQVPLPKVPPIVVAAKAIPNSLSVPELYALIELILCGLLNRGVAICSYSCDGTETERSLQRMLVDKADHHVTHSIPHPLGTDFASMTTSIAFFQGHPIVMIQDSKHALKTFRNNLFSGARLLVLGNDVAMYGWAHLLAFLEDSPLFNRDVEKIDHQDDNAVTRLFSATTLEYLTTNHSERAAMVVYLFVMGELVDAYQNRHISHLERIKMVLRARYFLDTWRAYLKAAGYAELRYYISREAADIARILIEGLIGLVVMYRDHLSSESAPLPLIPWLHSSEICEHVFAECRKLVKDFTHLDFLYMVPHLHILLRSIIRFTHTTNPKERAAGYAHSYFDTRNIDLGQLAVFPADSEIEAAAHDAWEEARSLFGLVGIVPADFLYSHGTQPPQPRPTQLPSISSWFPLASDGEVAPKTSTTQASHGADTLHQVDDDSVSVISSDDDLGEQATDSDYEDGSEAAELQRLINDHHQAWNTRSHHDDEKFLNLSCAAVALSMNDSMIAQRAAEVPAEELDDLHREARQDIQASFDAAVRKLLVELPPEPMRPFDLLASVSLGRIDYSPLVQTRRTHETRRAAQSVRTSKSSQSTGSDKADDSPQKTSSRCETIREMHAVIRRQQQQGAGTGLERSARWTAGTPEAAKNDSGETGNSVNATLAAGRRAATVLSRHLKIFSQHKVPESSSLADAMVGKLDPQQPKYSPIQAMSKQCYGLICHESRVLVGRVLAVYCRDGSKGGKHVWRESVDKIGLVSYLAVQVYEPVHGVQFRGILRRMAPFQTLTFALISSDVFLRLLPGTHSLSLDQKSLTLDSSLLPALQRFTSPAAVSKIILAVNALSKARRKSKEVTSVDDDGNSGLEDT